MDEFEIRRVIYNYIKEICHYSQMQVFATSYYQKNYFQMQIDETINNLINFYLEKPSYSAMQQAQQQPWLQFQQQTTEQPGQEPQQEPQQQTTVQPGQEPQQQPQQQTTEQPGQEPQQEPQQQTTEQPGQEPQQQTTEQSGQVPRQQSPEESQGQQGGNEMRVITLEELAVYDGSNGKPSYVAVKGNVYDVSSKSPWAGGMHFGLNAGQDLSEQFMGCHQGIMDRLLALPHVGILADQGTITK